MIKVNKDKYKMGLVNRLIENIDKGIHTNEKLINKLKEIEYDPNELDRMKERTIDLYITAIEYIEQGNPILWGGEEYVYTKRDLWKKLNEIGVYYTVPLWKLDKTIEELVQTREAVKQLTNKEQQLINKLKGGE